MGSFENFGLHSLQINDDLPIAHELYNGRCPVLKPRKLSNLGFGKDR